MTLAELIAEVYTITGRPDRTAETSLAVRSATLKAHQSDYYYKDIYEIGVAFTASATLQDLDYRNLIPRWRSLKYLRKYDFVNSAPGKQLDIILPEQIFDRYSTQKSDICYVAGAYVHINSADAQQYYLLGCYVNPTITDSEYSSWIAQDHPYAIIYDAAATVFKSIGKDEEAAAYRSLLAEQISMLKMSNIDAVGF